MNNPNNLHNDRYAELSFDNEAPLSLATTTNTNQQLDQILKDFGSVLDHADQSLVELSRSDLLGTAIVRGCRDLATAVGQLASELEHQSESQQRELAEACWQDAQEQQRWQASNPDLTFPQAEEDDLLRLSPDDILSALVGVAPLLRDVEVSLKAIEQDEADEIAQVALTLARLFVASLQSFHSNMLLKEEEKRQRTLESNQLEFLEEEEENTSNYSTTPNNNNNANKKHKQSTKDRVRVLWPPLGPAVANACQWGKEEAIKQPILAVALGMTLWPAAVATAFLGAPLVVADTLVQHTYSTFQEGAIVSNLERGAAQLYQAGKLSLLCGKFLTKQSLRVLHRQVDRQGGVGPALQNLAGMAVDRALHPVETAGAVWDGVHWAFGIVQENWEAWNRAGAGLRFESGV